MGTNEVPSRLTDKGSRSPTTTSSKNPWAKMVSTASKIWSTKSTPSAKTSRLLTTTCTQSNFLAHEEAGEKSPTTSSREVTLVTENNTLTLGQENELNLLF